MAIVYAAQLRPSKMELLADWLPQQPWFEADDAELVRLGSFRFDDPEGEVGIESHFIGAARQVFHVPLTYRGAPLEGAEAFLITTMDHSVLGERWVYDATGDPVYASALADAILAGSPQAVQMLTSDGETTVLPETATIAATGVPVYEVPAVASVATVTVGSLTTISAGHLKLQVHRALDLSGGIPAGHGLTAVWDGQKTPVLIATA